MSGINLSSPQSPPPITLPDLTVAIPTFLKSKKDLAKEEIAISAEALLAL